MRSKTTNIHLSQEDMRIRFANIRVLVADRDLRVADLVRRVLFNFGFRKVEMVDSGAKAIDALDERSFELLITEWNMSPVDGIDMVRAIRRAKRAKRMRRDIPIIMLTGKAEKDDVQLARDSGITEFLVKPFNAKTLSDRIIKVIDYPRIFVDAPIYAGPCRRRKRPTPPGGRERRSLVRERLSAGKELPDMVMDSGSDLLGLVAFLPPNVEMKQHVGADVTAQDILNDRVIAEGQEAIQEAANEFVEWVRDDIAKLEEAYGELKKRPTDPTAHHLLLTAAYAIKTQAGTFGYDLGSEVGKMLVDYLTQHPVVDESGMMVVRKHIDAIAVIFNQKIKETGREIAEELVRSLHQLIRKMG
ncbi:MAG: response regulator [Alphaproteobacteria bacterium]|nr:response regulator [Alphaproteobacteria bacterium]